VEFGIFNLMGARDPRTPTAQVFAEVVEKVALAVALNNILLQKLGTRLMQAGAFSRPRRHKSHPDYPIISARVPR